MKHTVNIVTISTGRMNNNMHVSLPDMPFAIPAATRDETAPTGRTIRREVRKPSIRIETAYDAFVQAWKEAAR